MGNDPPPVKIAFFMQDTGSVFGAERATLDLAMGLHAAGELPIFFLMRETRLGEQSALRAAIAAHGFAIHDFSISGRFSLRLARAVRSAFRVTGADVLHVLGYKAHVHAWLAGIRPRVSTVHGWLFRADKKEQLYGYIEQYCLRRCDRVICLSRYYENYLLAQGLRQERLIRIPSGLRDIPAHAPVWPYATEKAVTFGMMGRFSEEKNHAMFIAAAKMIQKEFPRARFVIAGTGPLEHEIRAAGIGAMPGYVPVDDFFRRIDVYVICSKIENLPYSILEAMARERPVIGTRVGGIPDLVENRKTGRLVESDAAEELAGAMREIMMNETFIPAWGKAGREKMAAEFDATACVRSHIELYRQISRG